MVIKPYEPISDWDVITLRYLLDMVGKEDIQALEVGCGKSTEVLLERCDLTIIECNSERAAEFDGRAKIFIMDSGEYRSEDKFDFIFIDGDHTYTHIGRDLDIFCPRLAHRGIICGHDYEGGGYYDRYINQDCVFGKHHGVIKAVDEKFGNKVMKAPKGTVWWVK